MKGPAEIAHGPMFIGFTFNVLLYGVMITQVYIYYTTYPKDRTWMKCFVLLIFVADTANTIFNTVYLYDSLIKHFGDIASLGKANWLFATDPALTGIIASLVQLFFAWRVYVLTRSWALATLVCCAAIAGGVSGIVTAHEVIVIPQFTDFQDFQAVVIVWLTSASICDIMITSILVWYLKHKTGFKSSDAMVDRLIRLTVQTGLLTSVVAMLDLITFLTDSTGTHLIFNFPLCKLYSNSLMSSLNSRGGWKYGCSTTESNNHMSVVDSEKSTGPGTSSHMGDIEFSRAGDEEASQSVALHGLCHRCHSRSQVLDSPEHNKFAVNLFNARRIRVRTSKPEVHVFVESHELRDALPSGIPSSGVNDGSSPEPGAVRDIEEIGNSQIDSERSTIVTSASMNAESGDALSAPDKCIIRH